MTTVVICDTEPIAAVGLQSVIENLDDIYVAGAEASVGGGMDAVRELAPNLLIVDKSLGSQSVLDWITGLRVVNSPTAVLVWGGAFTESEAVRYLQAGAGGVIRKSARLDALLSAIATVAGGGCWMDQGLLGSRPARRINPGLTTREMEVMQLVERGFKNKEIASSLGIQTGTVKIHLRHIYEKTGVRCRYGLALSGLRERVEASPEPLN